MEVTVPAKRTPWPDAPPELRTIEKVMVTDAEKHPRKSRSSRSRHGSRKRKHESPVEAQISSESSKHTDEN